MTSEKKLEKIKQIYDTQTPMKGRSHLTTSTHARHNLLGAYMDMKRTGKADKVCLDTIKQVMWQLARIERVLGV